MNPGNGLAMAALRIPHPWREGDISGVIIDDIDAGVVWSMREGCYTLMWGSRPIGHDDDSNRYILRADE